MWQYKGTMKDDMHEIMIVNVDPRGESGVSVCLLMALSFDRRRDMRGDCSTQVL